VHGQNTPDSKFARTICRRSYIEAEKDKAGKVEGMGRQKSGYEKGVQGQEKKRAGQGPQKGRKINRRESKERLETTGGT